MRPLAIVDLETTGLNPMFDRVIEVGVVLVDKSRISHTYSTLVNPGRSISGVITSITGITQNDLTDAPSFEDIVDELNDLFTDRVLTAHNASFDYGFLRYEFSRTGRILKLPRLCTVRLSRRLYWNHKGHGLDKVIERFGIHIPNRHRALGDALAVWQFISRACKDKGVKEVEKNMVELLATPAIPNTLKTADIANLPTGPGVYIFYNQQDTPIYVGKSVNIRDRVMSHFYAEFRDLKEMKIKERISRIETRTTAGELEALLMEVELVRKMQPVYNRQLKKPAGLWVLSLNSENKFTVPDCNLQSRLTMDEMKMAVGVFKTRKEYEQKMLKLAWKYKLCLKILRLEKGKREACFRYHLGECNGACVKKETARAHNVRLMNAMREVKISTWPFGGKIAVSEYNETTNQTRVLVFNQWCYLGGATSSADMDDIVDREQVEFDLDIYKLIKKYLKQPGIKVSVI